MNEYNNFAELKVFIQNSQHEIWVAKMACWVKEVVLHRADPDIEATLALLSEQRIPDELLIGVKKILNGEARSAKYDCIEIHKAQWVIGEALATLFIDSSENALTMLHMVSDWHCWEGFSSRLSNELSSVDRAAHFGCRFIEAIADLEANPQDYVVFRDDKQYFMDLNDTWKNERILSEVWNPIYGWQNVTMHLPSLSTLTVLLPNYPQTLVAVIEKISYPPIVNNILLVCLSSIVPQISSELMRQAASCMVFDSERKPIWNRKLLAPLLMEWCISYGTHTLADVLRVGTNSNDVNDKKTQLGNLYKDMVSAMMTRDDKFFLGEAFLVEILARRIHRRDVDRDPQALALSIFGDALKEALAFPEGELSDTLFTNTFGVAEEEAAAQAGIFAQTGIPLPHRSRFHLTSLLALVERTPKLTEEHAKNYLHYFNILLCFKDAGLYTSEHSDLPDERHEKIAKVYAAITDPQASWQETWRQLSGVRYKLHTFLFNEESSEQRYVLNFVLVCGVIACKILETQGKRTESHALLHVVKQAMADFAQWDWFQERFFTKLQELILSDGNAQVINNERS